MSVSDHRPSPRRLRPAVIVVAVLALALLIAGAAAAIVIALLPDFPAPTPRPPVPAEFLRGDPGGAGLLLAGGFILFMLMVPFYLALLGALFCGCAKGIAPPPLPPLPLPPGLPDLRRVAAVLREVARTLESLANTIDAANVHVEGVRDKVTNDFLSLQKPVVHTYNVTTITGHTVKAISGIGSEPVFDDTTKSKLRALSSEFADDAGGRTVLENAARNLRAQAEVLKLHANGLEGQE